jgi:hypothetical protein
MQPIYAEEDILDPRQLPAAYDTSGVPVPPSPEGFQLLGEVQGSALSNAYLAEQEAQRRQAMTAKERADAEQAAIRFAGQQKYRALIDGGAKPAEALRLAGPELFWNNPAGLVSSVRATREATPFEPSVVNRNGRDFAVTGPNRAQLITPPKQVMPPDVAMNQKLLMEELKRKTTGPLAIAADPKEIAGLEQRLLEGSTNWMKAPVTAPASPATDAANDALPLPKTEADLKKGAIYQTRRGPATWNGSKFVQ